MIIQFITNPMFSKYLWLSFELSLLTPYVKQICFGHTFASILRILCTNPIATNTISTLLPTSLGRLQSTHRETRPILLKTVMALLPVIKITDTGRLHLSISLTGIVRHLGGNNLHGCRHSRLLWQWQKQHPSLGSHLKRDKWRTQIFS